MSTSVIALGIAGVMVVGLIVTLGVLSLVLGGVERYLGKPKFTFLKTKKGETGFAFAFDWNEAKEPATYDVFKLRLFNPFGSPADLEVAQAFDKSNESFVRDLSMGPAFKTFMGATNFESAQITIEIISKKDGINFIQEMKGKEFLKRLEKATDTIEAYNEEEAEEMGPNPSTFGIINRDTIADTVPGKGPMVAVPSNPAFAQFFGSPSGEKKESAEAQENFSISKVWIEDGCIVCNACEDIYPEVFEVIADGCLIRPGFPTDDGLKIQEAAEACPVEIIKFQTA